MCSRLSMLSSTCQNSISFLRLNNSPLSAYATFYWSIYLSMDIWVVTLPFMNNAATNIGIQLSVWASTFSSFGYIPRSRVAEYTVFISEGCVTQAIIYEVRNGTKTLPSKKIMGISCLSSTLRSFQWFSFNYFNICRKTLKLQKMEVEIRNLF